MAVLLHSWQSLTMPKSKSASPSPDPARKQDAIDPAIEVPDDTIPDPQAEPEEEVDEPSSSDRVDSAAPSNPWQAILSPQHNAYYFYNTQTHQTTWTNPLQPDPSSSASAGGQPHASTSRSPQPQSSSSSTSQDASPQPSASTSHYAAMQAAAIAAGIDPSLAHLDPSLAASTSAAGPLPNTFTAKFNARTGAFTAGGARDPGHLSEFEVSLPCLHMYRVLTHLALSYIARKTYVRVLFRCGRMGERCRSS